MVQFFRVEKNRWHEVSDDETANGGSGQRNADFPWAQFDSEAYFQHYYGDPHPDDDRVTRCAAAALQYALPSGAALDVVDIGTGPNLIPFLCALARAKSLTAWEFSESNIAWLERELSASSIRPQWQHFWDVARQEHDPHHTLPDNPIPLMRSRCNVTRGSIFELPERRWDAATMFFCAESITGSRAEFVTACTAFARAVKPGGTLAAAFLVRSAGYEVGGRRFPAVQLSAEDVVAVFETISDDIRAEKIGIVDKEVRSGYAGALFLAARSR
jgi:hypothetical protein